MNILPPEELEKVTKALWAPTPRSTLFSITEEGDKFVLDNLQYRGGLYRLEWGKELLDGGKSHTQEEWVTQFPNRIPNVPLYHAAIMALYRNRDGYFQQQVEEMKERFIDDFRKFGLMTTSSRVIYRSSEEEDRFVHGYKSDDCFFSQTRFGCGADKKWKALLDTTDLEEMELAYEWLTGQRPPLWRFYRLLGAKVELVITLDLIDGLTLQAQDSPDEQLPAHGVIAQRISE